MGWKIWLDDIRPAPDGWVQFRRAEDCIKFLEMLNFEVDMVDHISVDNDLGDSAFWNTDERVMEGVDFMNWLEERMLSSNRQFEITCHSANPVAKKRIDSIIERIYRGMY